MYNNVCIYINMYTIHRGPTLFSLHEEKAAPPAERPRVKRLGKSTGVTWPARIAEVLRGIAVVVVLSLLLLLHYSYCKYHRCYYYSGYDTGNY